MMPRTRRGNIVTKRGVYARDTGDVRRGEKKRNGRKGETAPERRITCREIWLERPRGEERMVRIERERAREEG